MSNGIPIDHRLQSLLPGADLPPPQAVGKHARIAGDYGHKMIRDDGSRPSRTEAEFAAWLAEPHTQGGVVIALLQPAKSQVYTADFPSVNSQCPTLAYLQSAVCSIAGPEGWSSTSVFDAFPFITEPVNSARRIGRQHPSNRLTYADGHEVRVVNGFHPSYVANYNPNESRFRRLFSLELCKAFGEAVGRWEEAAWMDTLRDRCRDKAKLLMHGELVSTLRPH